MSHAEGLPHNLVKIDIEGNLVACVIHTRTWTGMAVSALECGLLPIAQTADGEALAPRMPDRMDPGFRY